MLVICSGKPILPGKTVGTKVGSQDNLLNVMETPAEVQFVQLP